MKIIHIILQIIFCVSLGYSQYPILDDFTSIGATNEWTSATGQPDMCAHTTNLCYNCTWDYLNSQWYSFESPNYGNQFINNGCDSMYVEFNVSSMNIRPNDQLQFWWFDGFWNGVIIPSSGTWSIYVPNTVEKFSFDFITGPSGSAALMYVHIDYIYIDCIYTALLPINLYDFGCSSSESSVEITADISDTAVLKLEWSNTGYDWIVLDESNASYLTYTHNTIVKDNYYRLKYDNEISNIVHCNFINKSRVPVKIIYYNILGQHIKTPVGNYIQSTTYDDGSVETQLKIENKY